jgi:superfamily II DNA or RNA helicase
MFDHLVEGPTVATLVDHGYLSTARVFAPPQVADLSGLRSRGGDYAQDQLADRLDRPTVTGDAIDHYQRLCNQKRAIAFCCSAKHAESVATAFNLQGVPAATLLGTTPTEERDQLVRQFAAGTIRVLVTVDVVSEGFDCPAAEVAILLRPTQSEGLYLQQVGRVLRPAPGKPHALILDHVGNVHRHGFPDDHRDWSLADRPRRGSKDGAPAPTVRTCETCFAAFAPQPVCPVCGTPAKLSSREIQQREGELQELARAAVAQARARDRRQQGKARSLPELLAIAKQRGYSAGWAYKLHNARSSRA